LEHRLADECRFRYPAQTEGQGTWSPMICPQCRSVDCFRSHRDGALDFVNTMSGLRPWRCHACDKRFYAWRVATRYQAYAHCPRCGNFDLEHISRERVEDGTMITLKRWLGFRAYRCDPCRHRFFSIRRYRRILPVLLESPTSGKAVAG
jgi:phage FluMu protein Com